ncbi:MAG: hypothetical protein V3T21_04610, partial [Candidatus Margulisiibacteriota bacterium]
IIIVDQKEAVDLVDAFNKKGIVSSVAGEVVSGRDGMKIKRGGKERILEHPKVDPYWILAEQLSK